MAKGISVSQYTICIVTEAARAGENFVSQYTDCIVTERQARQGLYCNTPRCIVNKKGARQVRCVMRQATIRPCLHTHTPNTRPPGLRYGGGPGHDTALGAP